MTDDPIPCPSCGTNLDDVAAEVTDDTCPQCERDLTLPEDAVKSQLCLLCKIPEEDSDELVEYQKVGTGERLCSNCLADLRAFKFDLAYQLFTAEWLADEHTHAIDQALFEIAEEFEGAYRNLGNTNAAHARMGQADSPQDEMQKRLEDLDEDERQELRDALDEAE